jgi:hypothetical protein
LQLNKTYASQRPSLSNCQPARDQAVQVAPSQPESSRRKRTRRSRPTASGSPGTSSGATLQPSRIPPLHRLQPVLLRQPRGDHHHHAPLQVGGVPPEVRSRRPRGRRHPSSSTGSHAPRSRLARGHLTTVLALPSAPSRTSAGLASPTSATPPTTTGVPRRRGQRGEEVRRRHLQHHPLLT